MMVSSLVYATSNNSESDELISDGSSSDNEVPGEDKVEVVEEEEHQNTENDDTNNIPDTNIGLFDSGAVDKNIPKDKDVLVGGIETAYLYIETRGGGLYDYFGSDVMDGSIESVSVCVDTAVVGGSTVSAVPHCMTGLNATQQFAVEPGQIIIDIQHSPRLTIDNSYDCPVKYLVPKEWKDCIIVFIPTPIEAEITPKPNSDFD
jgi:hypothetical protein